MRDEDNPIKQYAQAYVRIHRCTSNDPFDELKQRRLRVIHPDAQCIAHKFDIPFYRCPHCGWEGLA